MKHRFLHSKTIFEDGDMVTVTTYSITHGNPYTGCMIVYDNQYPGSKWYILSDNKVFNGRVIKNKRGYKYSWAIDTEIERIEHANKKIKGKWANGGFRRKLIDKNII